MASVKEVSLILYL